MTRIAGTRLARLTMLALTGFACILTLPVSLAQARAQRLSEEIQFAIPAQSLATALVQFSKQARIQLVIASVELGAQQTQGVSGRLPIARALDALLDRTGLAYSLVGENTVAITPPAKSHGDVAAVEGVNQTARLAQADTSPQSPSPDQNMKPIQLDEAIVAIPEVLVVGSKSTNADIRRTEDDAQPYVVFEKEEIQRSQTANLEEFLKTRLPMNTQQQNNGQLAGAGLGPVSSINLRGLGTNQTLILVDGRRLPVIDSGFGLSQSNINGIPVASIERIEVLPSTASGIYGGGATGGVINIITRKDYTGVDVGATYGDSFRGDIGSYRLDGSAGFSLEEGKTHILIAASHADSDQLFTDERDFAARARALQFANNPGGFYGVTTPPLGFTSNIRSVSGANLQLRQSLGGTPLSSPFTFVPEGYAGPASDNGAALLANAGRYSLGINDDGRGGRSTLLTSPTVDSATLNVRRELGATVDAFADFSWYDNSGLSYGSGGEPNSVTLGTDAPNNPFTTPIVVRFPNPGLLFPVKSEVETLRGIGGVVVRLPSEWTAAADYGWNRSRYRSTSTGAGVSAGEGAALTNGTLNVMRDLNAFPLDYAPYLLPTPTSISGPFQTDLNDATLRLSGPLFHIWGGPLTLSGLAEWRKEQSSDSYQSSMNASSVESATFFPSRSQTVMSYYLEARAPLASKLNGRRMLRALELQASVRRDDYETHVSNPSQVPGLTSRGAPLPAFTSITNEVEATKYTVGLRYVPVDDLALRASYGTGFLPPSVSQLVSTTIPVPGGAMLIDPKRGNILANTGQFNRPQGGNPDLVPEDSESWSAGVVFTPRFLAGLRLSIDYTRITKTNEITTPALQTVLDLEDLLPGRVTRSALLPADAALGYTAGVIKTIDTTLVNIAASRLEAYDIQADYQWRSARLGDFRLYAVATYQPQLARQTVPNKAFVDSVGFDSGVLEWRGNAGLTWDKGPWTLGWNAQYYAAYFAYTSSATAATIATAVLNQGSARVPSQMYHDIFAAYRFDDSMFAAGMLHGVVVTLGIQNLFDKSPPITVISSVATVTGGYSTYGDPRLQRFSLSLQKHF